jgi:hypothetical protein
MDTSSNTSQEFDTRHCKAKQSLHNDMALCSSDEDIYLFCPFVIFSWSGIFCFHPKREAIVQRSGRLLPEHLSTNADSVNIKKCIYGQLFL